MALYLGNLKISGAGGGGGTGSAAYEKKTVYPYADSSSQYAASDILASVFPIRFSIGEDRWVVNNGSNVNLESVHRNEDGRDVIELMIHGITIPGAPGAVDLTMGLCQIGLDGYYIGPANSDYYYGNDDVIDEGDLSVGQSNTLPVRGVTKFFNLSAAFKLSDRAMNFLAAPEHSTYTLDQLDQIIVVPPTESSSAPGKAREFTLVFDNEYCSSTPDLILSADRDGFYDAGGGTLEFKHSCVTVMNFSEVAAARGVNCFVVNSQALHNVNIPKLESYWGLTFTAIDAGAIVEMVKDGSSVPAVSLEYSLDSGNTWLPFIIGETAIILENVGDSVCFQAGNGGTGGDGVNLAMASLQSLTYNIQGSNTFKIVSGRIAANGDVSSILNRSGTVSQLEQGAFSALFRNCVSLVQAPELPAVTLANACYSEMFRGCTSLVKAPFIIPAAIAPQCCCQQMFSGCTSLTEAPELPATTLASRCYWEMFRGCTSLVKAPELPATTLAERCYARMFYGCTSLVKAPSIIPAVIAPSYCCELMFRDCTSLTEPPELLAVIINNESYSEMFRGCTSLVKAPELPATTLAYMCYVGMFQNCTSLTFAPELPATTLADMCYNGMFKNCNKLQYIKVHFTSWGTQGSGGSYPYTWDWVASANSSGVFLCKAALPHTTPTYYRTDCIPNDWTIVTF